MSEGTKAAKGVAWSAVERISTIGIQFVLNIIIARILSPSDYGVIGMLAIFLSISQCLIDGGFSNALIQRKDRAETDYGTVFLFNLSISVALYLVLFFSAPLIARFYNMYILVEVLRVVGLILIISALSNVQKTILTINVDFRTQSYVSISGALVSGVIGIIMAYNGFGVWSLVAQTLVNGMVCTVLFWLLSKTAFRICFNTNSFKKLGAFGVKLMFSNLLNTIYDNLYALFIGKKYSAQDLGYYSRADQFAVFPPKTLTEIINRVSYPIMCQHQDNKQDLSVVYTRFITLSCYIIFPLMIGLSVLSKPLIVLLLTDKWLPAALMMSILALDGLWSPITKINLSLLQAVGRSDLFLRLEIIKKIIAVCILLLMLRYGLIWVCVGRFIYSIIAMLINMYYTVDIIGKSYYQQIADWFLLLVVAVLMGGMVYGVTLIIESPALQLVVGCFVGIVSYYFFTRLFKLKEFDIAKNLFLSLLKRGK